MRHRVEARLPSLALRAAKRKAPSAQLLFGGSIQRSAFSVIEIEALTALARRLALREREHSERARLRAKGVWPPRDDVPTPSRVPIC
jgi:hypothetical protein